MTKTFEALSDDQVADEIRTWAGRVAAGEARLLALIAEYDRRQGWATYGFLSLGQWLSVHLGLAPGAAREKARTARALVSLPLVTAAICRGELSYSQVRAITRVASADDEQTWIELARVMTGSQLERAVAAHAGRASPRRTRPTRSWPGGRCARRCATTTTAR